MKHFLRLTLLILGFCSLAFGESSGWSSNINSILQQHGALYGQTPTSQSNNSLFTQGGGSQSQVMDLTSSGSSSGFDSTYNDPTTSGASASLGLGLSGSSSSYGTGTSSYSGYSSSSSYSGTGYSGTTPTTTANYYGTSASTGNFSGYSASANSSTPTNYSSITQNYSPTTATTGTTATSTSTTDPYAAIEQQMQLQQQANAEATQLNNQIFDSEPPQIQTEQAVDLAATEACGPNPTCKAQIYPKLCAAAGLPNCSGGTGNNTTELMTMLQQVNSQTIAPPAATPH